MNPLNLSPTSLPDSSPEWDEFYIAFEESVREKEVSLHNSGKRRTPNEALQDHLRGSLGGAIDF